MLRYKVSLISVVMLLISVATSQATLVYYADPARSDNSGDGRSWATAKRTLQAAIDATTTVHQVWAKQGTYAESITLKGGVALYGGFAGSETQLNDRSTTGNMTIIDGSRARSGQPAYHVVVINSGSGQRLDGFTITGGQATGSSMSGYGGGIYCSSSYSNISIANCTIEGNIATSGAGLYIGYCSVALTHCIIAGNSASTGGGVYTSNATWSADGCVISGNTASTQGGGLMVLGNGCALTNCILSGNSAGSIGGALNWQGWANSTIINCTISDNTAGSGGGIYLGNYGNYLTLQNTIFTRNTHHGVYEASTSCHPKLIKCLISGNPDGDYYDDNSRSITGANNINLHVIDTTTTLGGTPGFIMDGASAMQGTWSAPAVFDHATSRTTLTTAGPALTPGTFTGCLINPNTTLQHQFLVQDNTTSTVVVYGDATAWTHSGDAWKLVDYHLANGSDALNRGARAGAPPTDIDGDMRLGADGTIDIGADEAPAEYVPGPDSNPPISQVKALAAMITSSTLSLPITITDDQSGIKEIRLYYRLNGGNWTMVPTTFTLAGNPLQINTSTLGGDGVYEFYSVAVDNAGNVEPAPATVDAWTQVLSAFPSPRIYVDPAATQLENGLSWDRACRTLSLAMTLAARFKVAEVWVAQGLYNEGVTLAANTAVYGGFTGCSRARETALAQRNFVRNQTVINPCATAQRSLINPVTIKNVGSCRLDGFTLTGGFNASGLYCSKVDGSVVVANCTMRGNFCETGGGIQLDTASPLITSCTICNNIAAYGLGTPGGYYGRGGGIRLFDSRPVISHCVIANNTSGMMGGGIASEYQWTSPASGALIENCIISGNQALLSGGAIQDNGKISTVTNCIISGNTAGVYGGAIHYNWYQHPLTIRNTTFSGNAAPHGSVFYCANLDKLTLLNTIFTNHQSPLIYLDTDNPNIDFNHCLLYNPGNTILIRYATALYQDVNALNLNMPGAVANVAGDPCFTPGAQGTWTDAPAVAYDDRLTTYCTRFHDTHAAFKPGALAGKMIRPDASQNMEFLIQDNTTTSVLVIGRVAAWGAAGKHWQLADYHLGAGSAAAGRGARTGAPATDIDDQPRPGIDDLIDIGADEASPVLVPARETGAPTSQIVGAPAQAFSTTFAVPFTAADPLSGVRDVQLVYRRNGGAWMRYPTPNAVYRVGDSPLLFDTRLTGGDGYYELYTVAVDNDGNSEAAPAVPDATVSVVTLSPGERLYVNQNATGASREGSSWATACREVGDALNEAASLGGVKEIWVARGRYTKQMNFPAGVAVYGGFSGRESRLEDRSSTTYLTYLDGSVCNKGWWETQPVAMVNVANCRLDGFQITNGGISCNKATSCTISNCTISKGNGVFGTDSKLSIARCAISQNIHSNIYLKTSTATIEECTVYNGNLSGGYGIWGDPSGGGLNLESCTVTLRRCTVANNLGTGLYATKSPLTIDRCWFAGNNGGGIMLYDNGSYVSCPANLSNSILSGNTGAWGIALTVAGSYAANITNCTIADQTINGWGGAIWYANGGVNGLIQNTLFYNDRPSAIYEMYDSGWAPGKTLQNCIFYKNAQGDLVRGDGNPAVFGSTAINAQMPGAEGNLSVDPKFAASTIGGKWTKIGAYDATRGVTAFYDASAKLTPGALAGKIVAINTSHTLHLLALDNTTTSVLIAADLNQYGMAASGYVGNLWTVVDYHPGTGSGALDHGVGNTLKLDFDGNPRPVTPGNTANPKVDIGALESQGGAAATTHTLSVAAVNGLVVADPMLAAYPHNATVLLTPSPMPGYHFAGWSGDVAAGMASASPLLLTMDANKAVTALFASDRDAIVKIEAAPGTAPWTLQDGKNATRSGTGSTVLVGAFASPLRLTWGTLANFDLPTPSVINQSLSPLGGMATFTGKYVPHLGSVNITVWPSNTAWTLSDGLGGVRRGTGPARLEGILVGARSLSVEAPAGYRAPMPNPLPLNVTQGQEAAVSVVLLPAASDTGITYSRILRYLLGMSSDATGLDLNGDGKVTAADLLLTVKSLR